MHSAEEDRQERMQRVRVGLTGLAVVLLIVLLGTPIAMWVQKQAAPLSKPIAGKGDEPLADLGVAPGAPENASAPGNVVAPQKAAPPR